MSHCSPNKETDSQRIQKHETDELASQVPDTAGVYFVPAFSGLFAPYWRDDARGCIVGMTQYTTKCHIARATLEAVCFQTKEVSISSLLDWQYADSRTQEVCV